MSGPRYDELRSACSEPGDEVLITVDREAETDLEPLFRGRPHSS